MRLLFVADGRSPTALSWISHFVEQGHEVHLASTFACSPGLPLASLQVVPVAFSGLKSDASQGSNHQTRTNLGTVQLRTTARQWLGPLTLPTAARQLGEFIESLQPDLVHAMRIPYEGMVAALAKPSMPLLISVWGNDFTLHAKSTPLMGHYTRLSLQRAGALHTDCQRDMRLAQVLGYPTSRPKIVLPGNGGIRLDVFYPSSEVDTMQSGTSRGDQVYPVINPRGMRAYVRNDTFFQAVPLVAARLPGVRFYCPAMADAAQARHWVDEMGLSGWVDLLPLQTRAQMADLYRRSLVAVSPSTHDGTPNTLLEAMACGCFPVAGDIESLREWITPGENGLLFDPGNPGTLAQAILIGLEQPDLRRRARGYNLELVASRAEYRQVMAQAEQFYSQLVK